jgi:hypothetical protein
MNRRQSSRATRPSQQSAAPSTKLLMLDQLAHDAPENVPIRSTLTLTHREIAETIGASRETVTRLFAQFKRKGWIEVRGSALTLKDRAALETSATIDCLCPQFGSSLPRFLTSKDKGGTAQRASALSKQNAVRLEVETGAELQLSGPIQRAGSGAHASERRRRKQASIRVRRACSR